MAHHGKTYEEARKRFDREREYSPAEAVALIKQLARVKFNESVEVHVRTGLNVRHADEQLRGTIALPNGLGKDVKVAVFAQLLVRVADVQTGAHMHLYRLVELHARELLDQRDRLRRRVLALAVVPLLGVLVGLAMFGHHTTSTPIERAVPAMIFAAASMLLAFKSFIFFSAIWRS